MVQTKHWAHPSPRSVPFFSSITSQPGRISGCKGAVGPGERLPHPWHCQSPSLWKFKEVPQQIPPMCTLQGSGNRMKRGEKMQENKKSCHREHQELHTEGVWITPSTGVSARICSTLWKGQVDFSPPFPMIQSLGRASSVRKPTAHANEVFFS